MLVPQFSEDVHLLQQFRTLLQAHLVNLTHQHLGLLSRALLALTEGVVVLHDHDYLFGHDEGRIIDN